MKTKEITFVERNVAKLTEVELPQIGERDVLIRTEFTTISCGTEKSNLVGDECYLRDCIAREIPTGATNCLEKSKAFVEKYKDPKYSLLFSHCM